MNVPKGKVRRIDLPNIPEVDRLENRIVRRGGSFFDKQHFFLPKPGIWRTPETERERSVLIAKKNKVCDRALIKKLLESDDDVERRSLIRNAWHEYCEKNRINKSLITFIDEIEEKLKQA